jgi:FkbM family methyltransferase
MDTVETIEWHTLHPRYLGRHSIVLDIGANHGQFARAITDRFDCRCFAVEPSPGPFASIVDGPSISKLQAAVAEKSGTMPFHVASQTNASSLVHKTDTFEETIEVRTLSLADLFRELDLPTVDLLKVDIEGAEIGMLAAAPDALLERVAQMTIEFHDFCGITPADEVERTLLRLRRLGFQSVRMSGVGHQDTWLVNQRLLGISTAEVMYVRHWVRNWVGLKRVVHRKIDGLAAPGLRGPVPTGSLRGTGVKPSGR